MVTTTVCRWTFDGVTYEVDAPTTVVEGEGDDLVSGTDVERAEHAAVYAAMSDGIDDPATLNFARRSIGIGKGRDGRALRIVRRCVRGHREQPREYGARVVRLPAADVVEEE